MRTTDTAISEVHGGAQAQGKPEVTTERGDRAEYHDGPKRLFERICLKE